MVHENILAGLGLTVAVVAVLLAAATSTGALLWGVLVGLGLILFAER